MSKGVSKMKWLFNIIGVILILVGIVWFLQGINILLGSFMSGDPQYSLLGILLVVVGMILLAFTNRRNKIYDGTDSEVNQE
jgi:drug/metabolite transporter (DMT)-like permease